MNKRNFSCLKIVQLISLNWKQEGFWRVDWANYVLQGKKKRKERKWFPHLFSNYSVKTSAPVHEDLLWRQSTRWEDEPPTELLSCIGPTLEAFFSKWQQQTHENKPWKYSKCFLRLYIHYKLFYIYTLYSVWPICAMCISGSKLLTGYLQYDSHLAEIVKTFQFLKQNI